MVKVTVANQAGGIGMTWERITSQGKLVYWRRRLDDGSYLAVNRTTEGWAWAHRGPEHDRDCYRLHAEGVASSSTAARECADTHIALLRSRVQS